TLSASEGIAKCRANTPSHCKRHVIPSLARLRSGLVSKSWCGNQRARYYDEVKVLSPHLTDSSLMHTTPPSLLEQLRQPGQREAWDRFAELYTPLLYYFARSQGLAETDAADLVQEVFLLLMTKLPKFHYHQDGSFRAW